MSFNSILVRLKTSHEPPMSQGAYLYCFNSILVRLKTSLAGRRHGRSPSSEFQFHSGSIKGLTKEVDPTSREQESFNSILVRLKASPGNLPGLAEVGQVSIPSWFD